jgi:hypothetical protein
MVLGETFTGILGSDRLPAYLKYVVGQRQFCWAHLGVIRFGGQFT